MRWSRLSAALESDFDIEYSRSDAGQISAHAAVALFSCYRPEWPLELGGNEAAD